jgi:hypothetical protein
MKYVRIHNKYEKRQLQLQQQRGGNLSEDIPTRKAKETVAMNIVNAAPTAAVAQLVGTMVQTLLLDASIPVFLKSRAFWLFAIFAELFSAQNTVEVVAQCLTLLSSTQELAAKLQTWRALGNILSSYSTLEKGRGAAAAAAAAGSKLERRALIRSAGFGGSIIRLGMDLMSNVNESTAHFPVETLTAAVECLGDSLSLESLQCAAAVGMQALNAYSTDPLVIDVAKDLLVAIAALEGTTNGHVGVVALYHSCQGRFREWLIQGCAVDGRHRYMTDDDNTASSSSATAINAAAAAITAGNSSAEGDAAVSSGGGSVPIGLMEVAAELLGKMVVSPGANHHLLLANSNSSGIGGGDGSGIIVNGSVIMLSSLQILIAALQQPHNWIRRDCLQSIVQILSQLTSTSNSRSSTSNSNITITSTRSTPELSDIFGSINTATVASEFAIAAADIVVKTFNACGNGEEPAAESAGPAVGLFCHLMLSFSSVLPPEVVHALLASAVNCLRSTSFNYARVCVLMGLVHLFARNAEALVHPNSPLLTTSSSFSSSSSSGGGKETLGAILEQWCSMHEKLSSKYCSLISTLGMIELVKILSRHSVNHGIALKVLQVVLRTLPSILLSQPQPHEQRTGGSDCLGSDDEDEDDEDDVDDWENEDGDEDGDYDMEGEEEGGDDDGEGFDGDDGGPFAPAELYLSDMIVGGGAKGSRNMIGGGGDDEGDNVAGAGAEVYVNISDHLLFNPLVRDPLASADLQGRVIEMLNGVKAGNTGRLYTVYFYNVVALSLPLFYLQLG